MHKLMIVTIMVMLTQLSFAKVNVAKVKALVQNYSVEKQTQIYSNSLSMNKFFAANKKKPSDCHEDQTNTTSCIGNICAHLSATDCDDKDDIQQIAKMCVGNTDGRCISTVCSHLSSTECNDKDDLSRIAQMCSGSVTGGCVEVVCSKISPTDCNDKDDLSQITQMCKDNVPAGCILQVCSHLSSTECNDKDDLKVIAESCSHH